MTDSNPRPEEEIADLWSLEELKKSILDSASDYDRIVKSMNQDDNTTFTTMESKPTHEAESTSQE